MQFRHVVIISFLILAAAVAYWVYVDVLPARSSMLVSRQSSESSAPDTRWYTDALDANPNETSFTISTAAGLAGLAQIVNGTWGGTPAKDNFSDKYIKLAADLDLSVYRNWVPVGTADNAGGDNWFSGQFDGGGHVISGLTINRSRKDTQGLFGLIVRGRVANLGVEDVYIKGRDRVGGIAGELNNNSRVIRSYTTGKVAGVKLVGGVAGNVMAGSSVTNSYSAAAVSGRDDVAGIAGGVYMSSRVAHCYSTGAVSAHVITGGVAGSVSDNSSIAASAALNPQVKGRSWSVGRLVGDHRGTLTNNAAYVGIINTAGNTMWGNKGSDKNDAGDCTADEINASPTIGGRFRYSNGWTTAYGRLPGLHGKTVEMPHHLRTGAAPSETDAAESGPAREIVIDTITDARDGKKYRTVNIGDRTWMAENLNVAEDSSWCYANADSNCTKYGRLYSWSAAVKTCPAGWRLPDSADWNNLVAAAGGKETGGKRLKSASGWRGWEDDEGHYTLGNGTDELGFSALPGGYHSAGRFFNAGTVAFWWSATEVSAAIADGGQLYVIQHDLDKASEGMAHKNNGHSVRCVTETRFLEGDY
ncbi:MAG: fibrobacter succinogenes major paralogous domain-containing protein [Chitinispirillia bacterium]|nr:fibrobacter succinogenes major paralogous domain-containing protein [Chitinispirillia bacterium]MCL2269680.1 fibrobacter succinogenes major paralogous domain-containing protein [Chitinispirillia bacterium]